MPKVVHNKEHLVSTDDIILGLFGMTASELAVDMRKNKDTKYKDWFKPKESIKNGQTESGTGYQEKSEEKSRVGRNSYERAVD